MGSYFKARVLRRPQSNQKQLAARRRILVPEVAVSGPALFSWRRFGRRVALINGETSMKHSHNYSALNSRLSGISIAPLLCASVFWRGLPSGYTGSSSGLRLRPAVLARVRGRAHGVRRVRRPHIVVCRAAGRRWRAVYVRRALFLYWSTRGITAAVRDPTPANTYTAPTTGTSWRLAHWMA